MTSKLNISFNTSDQSLDLSTKNFWVIVHYPYSDPDCEYEIVNKNDIAFDSWEVLERGAEVTVKYGNAKVQGTVVTVSDNYTELSDNFLDYLQEYKNSLSEQKDNSLCAKHSSNKINSHVNNTVNKETQTENDGTKLGDFKYESLKWQYDQLQIKYNNLKAAVADVKSELQGTILKLALTKTEDKNILQTNSEQNFSCDKENFKQMVQIGSGGTKIPRHVYNSIKWTSYSAATRKLLITLFPRNILATHSLSGKPSPAFITSNKKTKMRLNPVIINDIIEIITKKCLVSESLVRNAITTKCADENKMYKKRVEKKQNNINDENECNSKK